MALELVWEVFGQFEAPEYSQQGVEAFRQSIQDEAYLRQLVCYGAFVEEMLVGVMATRNQGTHIALFFVKAAYQRQGIGRALFDAVRENSTAEKITVHASPCGVPVYKRLGFQPVADEQNSNGMRYTPMEWNRPR